MVVLHLPHPPSLSIVLIKINPKVFIYLLNLESYKNFFNLHQQNNNKNLNKNK